MAKGVKQMVNGEYLVIFIETVVHKPCDDGSLSDPLVAQKYKFILR